jgi:hypothetical protein
LIKCIVKRSGIAGRGEFEIAGRGEFGIAGERGV